jgi:phage terminase large subunit
VQEFSAYEYERDKYGNVLSGYPDKNDHTIAAVRYATESAWIKGGFITL